jgi:hypothetical protein
LEIGQQQGAIAISLAIALGGDAKNRNGEQIKILGNIYQTIIEMRKATV